MKNTKKDFRELEKFTIIDVDNEWKKKKKRKGIDCDV
jgi:hypothetical protein